MVESAEAEEGVRPQQGDAEGAILCEAAVEPARFGEGGQQQHVGPGDEADGETGQRAVPGGAAPQDRSEEHTSELPSLMRISYAVICLNKKIQLPEISIRRTSTPGNKQDNRELASFRYKRGNTVVITTDQR